MSCTNLYSALPRWRKSYKRAHWYHSSQLGFQYFLPILLYFTNILRNIHSYVKPSPQTLPLCEDRWPDLLLQSKDRSHSMRFPYYQWELIVLSTNLQTHLLSFILFPPSLLLSRKNHLSSYLKLIPLCSDSFSTVRNLTPYIISWVSITSLSLLAHSHQH